jgi:hypothetical protein
MPRWIASIRRGVGVTGGRLGRRAPSRYRIFFSASCNLRNETESRVL